MPDVVLGFDIDTAIGVGTAIDNRRTPPPFGECQTLQSLTLLKNYLAT